MKKYSIFILKNNEKENNTDGRIECNYSQSSV